MVARESAGSRLSVDDWLQAGYSILADDGLAAVKVDRLCERLGVTKGSFYWHFSDIAGYRTALIDAWAEQRGDERAVFQEIAELPPRERLSRMVGHLVAPRHWRIERAMREWARTDEMVAKGVDAADRRVVRMVREAFADLGFSAEDAEFRSHTTFAAGIGFLQIAGSKPNPLTDRQRERFLEFMVRP